MAPDMGLGVASSRYQRVLLLKNCLAIICRDRRKLSQQAKSKDAHVDGWTLFKSFVRENSQCFWNQCLVQCVQSLEYRGYIVPTTILVSGGEYSLDVVRSAWARRALRPPIGYDILRLGDITEAEMVRVLQTQFAPLAEALCKAVFDLTNRGDVATLDSLTVELMRTYPGMEKPPSDIVYKTLGTLIRERRLYHTGNGYRVAEPEQFMKSTPTLKRASLLTNGVDAAKQWTSQRVLNSSSGESRQSTLERSASMRLLRERDREKGLCRSASVRLYNRSKSSLNDHPEHRHLQQTQTPQLAKRDSPKRSSMFSRFFRKKEKSSPEIVVVSTTATTHHTSTTSSSSSGSPPTSMPKQRLSFAAQFPPVDWRDPDYVNFHSRSTQTNLEPEQTQVQETKAEIPSRSLSLARHCTAKQSSCCSDGTLEDSGTEMHSRRRSSSRSNSRSNRNRRQCSEEICCRHRSSSPPRRKNQVRKLPAMSDVSPLQLRKTHPRYLPAPPNGCKIPTLPPYPTSGLYRLNRPPLFPPAPPPNTDLYRQTERFRQHSSVLFHSTDEDSPQLPRKAMISTEKEIKGLTAADGKAQVNQLITASPKNGTISHTTTVTNSMENANNLRNSRTQLPRYTGNAYLRSLNNVLPKEKCTTTTRTTTTISEKIDGTTVRESTGSSSDYKSIVDVNVVTDVDGRTVTNIKTSVCASPKESPTPAAKVEKTKPECSKAEEKANSDTDLDVVDPQPKEQKITFYPEANTNASTGGNLSADDSGFLSTSPQPQSFVTA
ncbi:uncharacterized protein LOC100905291 [Galendromus occidentalis]|uniref:Uncharacterized protein LOC100905291 n=1 Tax=Galendromus occidentalis TaxID=34638 RepID=A0AAJ7SFQ6_9ACAR|nr:uncharacterized protein LOC100905291 [Galendromus occidentalis]